MSEPINDGKINCIVPGCPRTTRSRGLCDIHYTYVALLVKKGKHSWAELESRGRTLPLKNKKTGGTVLKDWLAGGKP